MAAITFTARKNANNVSAPTAKEAVQAFLAQFKNREFTVTEYRDGVFKARLYIGQGAVEVDDAYFWRKFTSRDEARAFCAE